MGLCRAMVANMVEGVSQGFEKKNWRLLELGIEPKQLEKNINLTLGFSHPVEMSAPEGVSVEMDKEAKNIIVVSGIDKQAVGEFCC